MQNNSFDLNLDCPTTQIKLKNGIRVLGIQTLGKVVYAEWSVLVGYDQELLPQEMEIVHFLEHMNAAFTSKNRPRQIDVMRELADLGISMQATTTASQTRYYMSGDQSIYQTMFDILFQGLTEFVLDENSFQQEARSVQEELQMRLNSPFHFADQEINRLLFKGHARAHTLEQSIKNVISITPQQILTFRNKYYIPQNITVIVAGSNLTQLLQSVSMLLSDWNGSSSILHFHHRQKMDEAQSARVKQCRQQLILPDLRLMSLKTTAVNRLIFTFVVPITLFHQDVLAIECALDILAGPKFSSRLMEKLRTELGAIYAINVDYDFDEEDPSLSTVSFQFDTHLPWKSILSIVLDELFFLLQHGISLRDLQKFHSSILFQQNNLVLNQHPSRFAFNYSPFFSWKNRIRTNQHYFSLLHSLTIPAINHAARTYLTPQSLLVLVARGHASPFKPPAVIDKAKDVLTSVDEATD